MAINVILLGGFIAFLAFLIVVETYCAWKGIPTISERLQWLGRHVPLVTAVICTLVGMLLVHFFGS